MNEKEKKLRSLREILDDAKKNHLKIFIPSYQRGYRWTNAEVTQLLDDITKDKSGGYFLQLLAVRRDTEKSKLRIIDGQQRLTTCLLALKELTFCSSSCSCLNLMEYETRKCNGGGIDKAYRDVASQTIAKYVEENSEIDKNRLIENILNCRFLYYDVVEEKEEMPLFHRLNMWKMPMRDSELVKCLILGKDGDDLESRCIRAFQWEQIERRLTNNRFLAFIARTPEKYSDDRFGLFLRSVIGFDKSNDDLNENEKFPLFTYVSSMDKEARLGFWTDVVEMFRQFETWFGNPYQYHLLGWYLHCRTRNNTISDELLNRCTLSKAQEYARSIASTNQDELIWSVNDDLIRDYLFLANVAFCASSDAPRYDFSKHLTQNPRSIEHIHARSQRQLTQIEFNARFAKHEELMAYWDTYSQDWEKDGVDAENKLCEKCRKAKIEYPAPDVDNGIGNLALLTDSMNSSFNNGPYETKRELVWKGWAPPLTIAVFNKMIPNTEGDKSYWTPQDRESYKKFLGEIITRFLDKVRFNALWEGGIND